MMTGKINKIVGSVVRWSLKIIASILLLIAYLLILAWWISPPMPERRAVTQPTKAEARWLVARHEYHGIPGSIGESGEHYFWRDGQKCKL